MSNEFMEKMLKANKRTLIREVVFSHEDIKNMSNETIEKNAREISSEAIWKDSKAKDLFSLRVLDAQAPNIISKAKKRSYR